MKNSFLKKLEFLIPPPVWFLIFMFLIYFLKDILQTFAIEDLWFLKVLTGTFFFLGVILDFYSVFLFYKNKTTINPMGAKNTKRFVHKGFYKYTRNPMYLGMVFILLAYSFYLGNILSIFLIPIFMLVITFLQIMPEEKILEKKFGQKYLKYKEKVRRWI